jgi:DNA-binding beta-propeller fold protein YncE
VIGIMQATRKPTPRSKTTPLPMKILAFATLGCALAACTADSSEVQPKKNELFFPTGMAVAPDDSVAFVINANSELRYDSGSIMVLNLNLVDQVIQDWTRDHTIPTGDVDNDGTSDAHADGTRDDCWADPDHTETLECDEARFFNESAAVRIGNFATDIATQDLGNGNLRLIVPTRGDPSIAWADWDSSAGRLSCSTANDSNRLCDDDHRLSFLFNDSDIGGIPEEPYNVYADSLGQFAMVTHLVTGSVTLIDSPRDGSAMITDVLQGIFGPDVNGIRGATGIVGRPSNNPEGSIVYVGSRTEDRIQTFTVGRPANGKEPYLLPGKWFFLDAVGTFAGQSSDTRGMTFSQDGNRLYLVNRRPATLQVIDTSISATGVPKDEPLGATDICRQGSTVAVSGSGADERAYVTCFQDGQVYVVDPTSGVYVEDIILSGRGPYAITAARSRNKLFVTNFLEDTIAVIDIAPSSPTRNRVVLRIGIPRTL